MASLRLPPFLFIFLSCTNALRRLTEDELVRPSSSSDRGSSCICRKHVIMTQGIVHVAWPATSHQKRGTSVKSSLGLIQHWPWRSMRRACASSPHLVPHGKRYPFQCRGRWLNPNETESLESWKVSVRNYCTRDHDHSSSRFSLPVDLFGWRRRRMEPL